MSDDTLRPSGADQPDIDTLDEMAREDDEPGRESDVEGAGEDAAPLSPEEQASQLDAEVAMLKDKLLRTLAETDNIRKRAERQVAEARTYAIERFAGDLLSVADNLARALAVLSDVDREGLSEAGKGLLGGIEMTQKELHTALARHGVVPVDAAPGAAFDPNHHQAVTQVPSDQPAGVIAQTFQNGWKINDRVLRAAMVAVSLGKTN